MVVPSDIIHFRLGCPMINHPFSGTPIDGNPIYIYICYIYIYICIYIYIL